MNSENLAQLMQATEKDQAAAARLTDKMKMATKMLMATALLQVAGMVYGTVKVMQLNEQFRKDLASYGAYDPFPLMSAVTFYPSLIVVLAILAIKEIRSENVWGWCGAVLVFLLAIPSWARPVAVIGLLAVLDESVRSRYLKELDIKI